MSTTKTEYVIILNFESGHVDALILDNKPLDMDYEEYIEGQLDYSLSNCEWMITTKPFTHNLNF
jgi:hypothetical protein